MLDHDPKATPMRLVGEGDDLTAVPEVPLPPLTDEMVREALEQSRCPSAEDVIFRARARALTTGSRLSPEVIVTARDADRR